ncbi:hypothetical protein J6590_040162 [Homalodisca vitripennis]|nr:hypothetical protein J6590_040162 [Homalodisca vitripennis]
MAYFLSGDVGGSAVSNIDSGCNGSGGSNGGGCWTVAPTKIAATESPIASSIPEAATQKEEEDTSTVIVEQETCLPVNAT